MRLLRPNPHQPHNRRRLRIAPVPVGVLLLLAGVVMLSGALYSSVSHAQPQQPTTQPPQPAAQQPGAVQRVGTHSLDEPIRLMTQASQAYQNVRNYTCTMIKQERIRGKLQTDQVISLKFREQPFSVYMHWQAPSDLKGQEVAFVKGRNNDNMRVRSAGLAGIVGWVTVSPTDARATEASRHSITEAGIGNLIERCKRDWARQRQERNTEGRVHDYVYDKRPCWRIETWHTQYDKNFYSYRTVVYLDKETFLPVRMEGYGWPREGGPQGGELQEVYSYIQMRTNVEGLDDNQFVR